METSGLQTPSNLQFWIGFSVVGLILFVLLFVPFMYCHLLPIVSIALFFHPKTPIHAIFALLVYVVFWILAMVSHANVGLPDFLQVFSEYSMVWGWGMFLVSYMDPFYVMAIVFNLTVLFPIVLLEIGYLLYKQKNWTLIFVTSFLFVSFCGFGIAYAESCAKQFETLEPMMGQTLPKVELVKKVGEPVYYRKNKELGFYIKGERMICVKYHNDESCTIVDGKGWFLD